MSETFNVAVIGGGASGLCLSVMLKRNCGDRVDVTVYESADRVGRKIAVTGNGRCNITNRNLNKERYHGDSEFAAGILASFGYEKQKEFFRSVGIVFVSDTEGKEFPRSYQASSVVDALRFATAEAGAKIVTGCRVTGVFGKYPDFTVTADGISKSYNAVVVATGGEAGGKLGSTDGYTILKSFGHKIEKRFPAIVQLKTITDEVRQMKGVKINAGVRIPGTGTAGAAYGEVLFTDYGLSGPPVMQVSRLVSEAGGTIILNMAEDYSTDEITDELMIRRKNFGERPAGEFLAGFVNKRVGQVVLKHAGVNISADTADIKDSEIIKITALLRAFPIKVTGNNGFTNAQVTAGGASCSQFFGNCMSKKAKGLFASGEVLDVDGDCGGFNLAFAWASAAAVADGVAGLLKEQVKK